MDKNEKQHQNDDGSGPPNQWAQNVGSPEGEKSHMLNINESLLFDSQYEPDGRGSSEVPGS
jgi:hypothetical protein